MGKAEIYHGLIDVLVDIFRDREDMKEKVPQSLERIQGDLIQRSLWRYIAGNGTILYG